LLFLAFLFSPFAHTTCLFFKQDRQKQQKHTCGVSKGAKQNRQKLQQHACCVRKGDKQDSQKQQ
jgi:hypothetical protein